MTQRLHTMINKYYAVMSIHQMFGYSKSRFPNLVEIYK